MKLRPSDPPATCQWIEQRDTPECGAPAHSKVKVMGGFTKAMVYLCEQHEAAVARKWAERRATEQRST